MLFEFDDEDKWSIGPRNIDQMYGIMLGDIFPEGLEIQAQLRANFDLIGSDRRSNPLFTPRFLSKNRFTLFRKRFEPTCRHDINFKSYIKKNPPKGGFS